ncbi:suppressor of disruption of TFIIS-like [Mercurialis annua]|uniref:suppressor of disruption of TFIIS-like n=1 Tax=Mercurialis annua TaxID=3986 RepID=UPI00215F203D|nr:suppressor of disruption of TFIIS-like [Mercurialis annua]
MAFEDQYQQSIVSKYDTLIFDVDDTLYPLSTGFSKQCTINIQEYMIQKLGIQENKVSALNQELYKNYGTSMAGLKAIGYDFDNDDYHSYVHGRLPYDNLKTDHVLRSLLLSLPIRKVIFSNADEIHVAKILRRLGLEDCFERIISFESINPNHKTTNCNVKFASENLNLDNLVLPKSPIICKPFEDAFEMAFKLANINPQTTVFFDDSIRNIQGGKRMGLKTVLVGGSNRIGGADYALESIHNIKEALPELWEANENNSETIKYKENVAIETYA